MLAPTKSQNLSAAVDASRSDKRRAGHTSSTNDRQNSNAPPLNAIDAKIRTKRARASCHDEVGSITFSATTSDLYAGGRHWAFDYQTSPLRRTRRARSKVLQFVIQG